MDFLWFILAGLAGGVLGGMGMGGGTILIPILTIFLGLGQHLAQGVNLIAFIPMGIVAIIIHAKNKLLDTSSFILIILPAIAVAVLASFWAAELDQNSLKFYFGIFLTVIGVAQLVSAIVGVLKDKKEKKIKNQKI